MRTGITGFARLMIGAGCVLVVLGVGLALPTPSRRAPPVVERFDFGPRRGGQVVRHEFQLTNPGARPLRVVSVRSTCACTVTEHPNELRPGSSSPLIVEARLPRAEGPFESTVVVELSSGESQAFQMAGQVLLRHPEQVLLPAVRAGEEVTAEVRLRSFGRRMSLENLDFDQELLAVGVDHQEDGDVLLRLTLKPRPIPGPYQTELSVSIAGEEKETFSIPLRGSVRERVEVSPPRLVFATGKGDAGMLELAISSAYLAVTEVLHVESFDPNLSADPETGLVANGAVRLPVRIERESLTHSISGKLHVTVVLEDGSVETVAVDVYVLRDRS